MNTDWAYPKRSLRIVFSMLFGGGAFIIFMMILAGTAETAPVHSQASSPEFQITNISLPTEILTRAHPVAITIEPDTGYVYVASTGRHEIVVIEGTNVITTIPVSPGTPCLPENRPASGLNCITDIEAHPQTGYVYAAQWQLDTHHVISGTEIVYWFVGNPRWNGPVHIAASPETSAAYVGTAFGSSRIGFICEQNRVDQELVALRPVALDVVTDGGQDTVFAALRDVDQLAVVQNNGTCEMPTVVTTTVAVGQEPTAVIAHPQTELIYVANGKDGDVSVISDTTVLTTLSIGSGNWPQLGPNVSDGYVMSGTTEIFAVHPQSEYVYVPNWVDDTVSVISETAVIATIPVGNDPNAIAVNPRSGLVYVANTADDTVSVIRETAVIATVAVAEYPLEIAVHPNGDVYVIGRDGDAVTKIEDPYALNVDIGLDTGSFIGFSAASTTDTRVLATGQVTVNLNVTGFGDHNAASLRVYTENDLAQPTTVRRGMVGQTIPTQTIPLKIWTPNFGVGVDTNGDGVPDVDNDLNWRGSSQAVWSYALDKNEPVTETTAPWDYPLFNYTDLFKWSNEHGNNNFHLPASPYPLNVNQPIHFALALEKKAGPQVYSTTVYVEFAVSEDSGNTFTTYREAVPISVTLNTSPPIVNLDFDDNHFNAFPNLDAWPQREIASGSLTLTLSAYGLNPYDAATIRVYTKNDPNDTSVDHLGLVGHKNRDWTVPLKVWTPNFGDGIDGDVDGIPDIDNDKNWRDNEQAVWVYAFDWNRPVTETWWSDLPVDHPYYDPNCAWCRSLFNFTDLFKWSDYHDRVDQYGDYVYHLPQYLEMTDRRSLGGADRRVPLYIAADFTDAFPQTYSTTLIIEFAFSDDMGESITQHEVAQIDISAEVPGDGSPVNWLVNRVEMRPDLDSTNGTVEKLADSYQESLDWSDAGWTYDQALAVIALTSAGHYSEAREILNALEYMQNSDGSWFFSYMTTATDDQVEKWRTTDELTLFDGSQCLNEAQEGANSYPDELEKRVCWDVTHNLPVDQLGPWLLEPYTNTESPQTLTTLPDRIKYRTYDFRKFAGTNAWVIMAINYYEVVTGDDSYRAMAVSGLGWLDSLRGKVSGESSHGGITMGRVWSQALVTDTIDSTYGFVSWPVYVAEHNFDAYSAFNTFGQLSGDQTYTDTANLIREFLLRELWTPHISLPDHPEVDPQAVDNFFYPGLNMSNPVITPAGTIDTSCIYLDGQSWSTLALDPQTPVLDKDGQPNTLASALQFAENTFKITDTTIFTDTGFMVTGINGYNESTCAHELVWSEGSEGMVSAYHFADNSSLADEYHQETESYMLPNGGVPYSTLPSNPSDPHWNWTDAPSIAGTAWFYFNEQTKPVNPFQPWGTQWRTVFLPTVLKK